MSTEHYVTVLIDSEIVQMKSNDSIPPLLVRDLYTKSVRDSWYTYRKQNKANNLC